MTPRARLPGFEEYESAGADFDRHRFYRYSLHRMWGGCRREEWRTVLWLMLNPSTADEHVLDPTLKKCQGFTRRWGFHGFEVCNLFALRSTDPKGLYAAADPVGRDNDEAIRTAAERNELIVCGWGTECIAQARASAVDKLLCDRTLYCLGTNQDGSPQHPLYIPYATSHRIYRK